MKSSLLPLAGLTILSGTDVVNGSKFPDCVNGPLANNTVCDIKASPADRAAALVKAMNITEKLANLVDNSLGAERLGLPPYQWWNEALHGVAASPGVTFNRTGGQFSYATSFANAITMAAAFDDYLVYEVGTAISTEARAFINAGLAGLEYWTPNINPYKDPRWGRGAETPGEDPFRIKGYTKAIVAGLEGNQSIRKVIATCKHFAAYDLERWKGVVRYGFNAVISSQDLSEYYLPPFQQCARDSKAGSFMCSYNALNGTPACASTYLMNDILREHWGWKEHNNFITSDCNAIQDFLPIHHNFSQTPAEAAAIAYESGTDTVCEVPGYPPLTDVIGAYNQTLLPPSTIDTALRRLYEGLIRAGYFDPPSSSPYRSIGWSVVNTPATQSLALRSATSGIVLLKNTNRTLPLSLTPNSVVALIGHWSTNGRQMLGPYSGVPPFLHSPDIAARQRNITYLTAPGPIAQTVSNSTKDTWTLPSLAAAANASILIYFGGTDMSIASEDRDRESIAWSGAQLAHITTLAALGKPLIVVQLGDQVDDTPLLGNANVSAVLWAGYPGQSGGAAVWDVVMGRVAPAGRLPVTMYPGGYVDQVGLTEMRVRPVEGEGGSPGRTYRWYKGGAVLPFGFGLGYAGWEVDVGFVGGDGGEEEEAEGRRRYILEGLMGACNASVKVGGGNADLEAIRYPDQCRFATLRVSVTNTGTRSGANSYDGPSDYVALVFLRGEFGPKPYPIKTLVGYKRVRDIRPGETKVVEVEVRLGELARVDASGNLVLYPGEYQFVLDIDELHGGNREGEGEKRRVVFDITGQEVVLDWFPQPN